MLSRWLAVVRSLAFYAIFYGGSVILVLLVALAKPFGEGALQRACWRWSAYHRVCARFILGIKVRIVGELPTTGALVAIRHESFFEAIDLPRLLGLPAVFAKIELMRIPFWGRLAESYGLIGVEREQGATALRKMVKEARRYKEQDRLLAIFPEGTRTPHGVEGAILPGFAGIYKLLDLPVVPISVDSGPLYHKRWKRSGTITYRVGEVIPTGLPRAEVEQRVCAAINMLGRS